MPGVPTLADTWKVTYKSHLAGEHIENVVHVTAPFTVDPQDIADDCGSAYIHAGSLQSRQSSQCIYDTIAVQPYDGASAPTDLTVGSYTGASGGFVAVPTASQVAWIITMRTALAGRSHRGRMYVGVRPASYLNATGTAWATAAVTADQSAADTYLTQMQISTHITELVVYSRLHNTKAAVSSVVSRPYLGTVRGRANAAMHV